MLNNPPMYAELSKELGYEFGPIEELQPEWTFAACETRAKEFARLHPEDEPAPKPKPPLKKRAKKN